MFFSRRRAIFTAVVIILVIQLTVSRSAATPTSTVKCYPKSQNNAFPDKNEAVLNESITYTCPRGLTFEPIYHTVRAVTAKCLANNTVTWFPETCKDINECLGSPCHQNASCTNSPSSFFCACKTGFLGDGFTCAEFKCQPIKPFEFGILRHDLTTGVNPITFALTCKNGFELYPQELEKIKCVYSDDKGRYEWHSVQTNEKLHPQTTLRCFAPLKILTPKDDELHLVAQGENLSATCTAKGFPYPKVTWVQTKKVVEYVEDFLMDVKKKSGGVPTASSTLEILDIVPELSGNYSCEAFVKGPPIFPFRKSARVSIQVVVSGVYLYNLKLVFKPKRSQSNTLSEEIVSAMNNTFFNKPDSIVLKKVEAVNHALNGNTSYVELSVLHQGQPNEERAKQITSAVWEKRDTFPFAELLSATASPIEQSFSLQKLSEQPVTNFLSAQAILNSVQQATSVHSRQLSKEDADRVTTVLERVNAVLHNKALTESSTHLKRQIVEGSVQTASNVIEDVQTEDPTSNLPLRLVPVLESIAAVLPPQRNLSNGEAAYGSVVTSHISVASLRFRESPTNYSVAMLFYKTNLNRSVQNGSTLSGKRLREEKLEAIPAAALKEKIDVGDKLAGKLFQVALEVSWNVVQFAKTSCDGCWANQSVVDGSHQPAVIFTLFEKTEFFADKSLSPETKMLASPVVALKVTGAQEPLTNLPENVSIHFPYIKTSKKHLTCVYWNYLGGNWLEEGCTGKYDNNTFICSCNHLTNFALLLSEEMPVSKSERLALEVFSEVGCGLSILGTVGTIFLHFCERAMRQSIRSQLVAALSANLLMLIVIFLAGVDETGNTGFCRAASLLIHYFLLTTFCWMASSSYLLFIKLVLVVHTSSKSFFNKAVLFSQGVPALIVCITAAADWEAYGVQKLCRLKYGASFFISLVTPLAILMAANTMVFSFAMGNIVHRLKHSSVGLSKTDNKILLKAAIKLFVSLGLTWITGLFVLIDAGTAFQWIFTIFVSSQGVFIFLLQRAVYLQGSQKHQRDSSSNCSSWGVFGTLLRRARARYAPQSLLTRSESCSSDAARHLPSWLKPKSATQETLSTTATGRLGQTCQKSLETTSISSRSYTSTLSSGFSAGDKVSTRPSASNFGMSSVSNVEVAICTILEVSPATDHDAELPTHTFLERGDSSADAKKTEEQQEED